VVTIAIVRLEKHRYIEEGEKPIGRRLKGRQGDRLHPTSCDRVLFWFRRVIPLLVEGGIRAGSANSAVTLAIEDLRLSMMCR